MAKVFGDNLKVDIDKFKKYIKNGIRVPTSFVKIILSDNFQECFRMPNDEYFENDKLKTYKVDCNDIL